MDSFSTGQPKSWSLGLGFWLACTSPFTEGVIWWFCSTHNFGHVSSYKDTFSCFSYHMIFPFWAHYLHKTSFNWFDCRSIDGHRTIRACLRLHCNGDAHSDFLLRRILDSVVSLYCLRPRVSSEDYILEDNFDDLEFYFDTISPIVKLAETWNAYQMFQLT